MEDWLNDWKSVLVGESESVSARVRDWESGRVEEWENDGKVGECSRRVGE